MEDSGSDTILRQVETMVIFNGHPYFSLVALRLFSLGSIMSEDFSWAGWPDKTRKEAIQFIISVEPWMPLLCERHGPFTEFRSRDGKDDPPDIEIAFRQRTLNFEITSLLPQRIGRYEDFLSRADMNCQVNSLNLSSNVGGTDDAQQEYALSEGPERWADPNVELQLWRKEATLQFDRKFSMAGNDFVMMHANPRHFLSILLPTLASFLNYKVQVGRTSQPRLILSSTCFGRNSSWLMEIGSPMQSRFSTKTYSRTWVERLKPGDKAYKRPLFSESFSNS